MGRPRYSTTLVVRAWGKGHCTKLALIRGLVLMDALTSTLSY